MERTGLRDLSFRSQGGAGAPACYAGFKDFTQFPPTGEGKKGKGRSNLILTAENTGWGVGKKKEKWEPRPERSRWIKGKDRIAVIRSERRCFESLMR